MNTPFDIYMSQHQVAEVEPQQTKSAAEIAFENAYWEAIAEKSASFENDQIRDLFNAAFEERTAKLAAQDPEYAEMLQQEQIKQAFNMGFDGAVQEVKQAAFSGYQG